MTEDPKKESKSIGRNIFAEAKSGAPKDRAESAKKENYPPKTDYDKPKSIGRNIFSETPGKISPTPVDTGTEELKIIEKSSGDFTSKERKEPGAANTVNALYISNENVVLAQTSYDGYKYKLTGLQIAPVELPSITEDNLLNKEKEDKDSLIRRLQIEAVDKVFTRAKVSKTDPHIVSSLNGPKIILKQIFVQNTPPENIEAELPSLVKSPFNQALSRYEHVVLNSDGMNHNVLVCIADSTLFFGTQGILASSGVECKILDIDKMAVVNLFNESVKPPEGSVSCIIDINYDHSHILIVPNGSEELYVRNIDFNFNTFRKTLQKNRDITLAETDDMIKNRNFYDYLTSTFEAETTENLNQHFSVKKYIRMQFLRELQKTFQYYSQQNLNKIPSKIYITGKAIGMNKFAQFVNKNTDIPCEILDITGFFSGDVSVLDYAKGYESEIYIALGLALRYE